MTLPAPTEADIQTIVDLVVAEVSPLRVVLFGSTARGEQRDNSDIDLMLVMPEGANTLKAEQQLHVMLVQAMRKGVARIGPVDFIVTTGSEYELAMNTPGLLYKRIAAEGKEVYAA